MANTLSLVEKEVKTVVFNGLKAYLVANTPAFGIEPPTTHHFGGGVYARRMFMSAGDTVVGHEHARACLNVIAMGRMRVINLADDTMVSEHRAGDVFESPKGTQRAIVAMENSCWITVHLDSGERDPDQLKEDIIK